MKCFKCHKLEHFQFECPRWDREANYAEIGEDEEMLLMSYMDMNNGRRVDVWLLDFGCSNRMCSDKSLFHVINEDYK